MGTLGTDASVEGGGGGCWSRIVDSVLAIILSPIRRRVSIANENNAIHGESEGLPP